MISKVKKNKKLISLKDESGLVGVICPKCGKRIPLLEIFRFDQIKGKDKNGYPVFNDSVDFCEEYECECGAHFQVALEANYIITDITDSNAFKQVSFQEETSITLDLQKDNSNKINLGESDDSINRKSE